MQGSTLIFWKVFKFKYCVDILNRAMTIENSLLAESAGWHEIRNLKMAFGVFSCLARLAQKSIFHFSIWGCKICDLCMDRQFDNAQQSIRLNGRIMSLWGAMRRSISSISANILDAARYFSLAMVAQHDIALLGRRQLQIGGSRWHHIVMVIEIHSTHATKFYPNLFCGYHSLVWLRSQTGSLAINISLDIYQKIG